MIINWPQLLQDGLLFSLVGSLYLGGMLIYNPRLLMSKGDYPDDVLAAAPPRTPEETRLAAIIGAPWFIWSIGFPIWATYQFKAGTGEVTFLDLFIHAFGILMVFNLVDLFVLDWFMFCTITPKFLIIPGTEGFAGYKDFSFHLKGHLYKGTWILLGTGLLIAGVVWLL